MFRGHGDGFLRRSRRLAGDKVWRTDLDLKVSGEGGLLDVLGDALIATILVVSQNAGGLEEETPSGLDWVFAQRFYIRHRRHACPGCRGPAQDPRWICLFDV